MSELKMDDRSCLYPREALGQEWLEVNGCGGYASSTVLNCHTRKYHGLLVANLAQPAGRQVMLSKFEDSLCLGAEEHFFSCHQYPGFFFPALQHCLSTFSIAPAPRFTYHIDGTADAIVIHKTIMLMASENCVLIRYDFENAPAEMLLRLKPFLAFRDFHHLAKQNDRFAAATPEKNGFVITPYPEMPPLWMRTNVNSRFSPAPHWYNNFEYSAERERGYGWQEDLFLPGVLEVAVRNGQSIIVAAALQEKPLQLQKKWTSELQRRSRNQDQDAAIAESFPSGDQNHIRQLLQAGRQFLIASPAGRPAIIAGYHWFEVWGRDTLISLPGLTFCSGRTQDGINILASLGQHEKDGLLPNFFAPDELNHAYNTVDASLWFFWAVQQQLKYAGDPDSIRHTLWPVMKSIIRKFIAGTIYNIYMAENGLLHAGDAVTHLTWMDARVGGRPVTPRGGFAVEINALWYNALCCAGELAASFGEETIFPADLPERVRLAFQDTFWIAEGAYLGDVYAKDVLDHAVRPNQIFALSLPFSPVTATQAAGVLKIVQEKLLTPCGLRTLAPDDPSYQGRCEGTTVQRDSAYHQGTVWPWLLGAFGEATLKYAADKKKSEAFLQEYLRNFLRRHLLEAGLGSISEIFDGDPPHTPRGCIAQAWSVGEIMRLSRLLQDSIEER
jgi:predicted glycogen debranching enzyme